MFKTKFVLYFAVFLCFHEAKALYFPSDSLKLKPKKYSHFVGLGLKTGGNFKSVLTEGAPSFVYYNYDLKNYFTLNYLIQLNKQKRLFFSYETNVEFNYLRRKDFLNDYFTGEKNVLLRDAYFNYVTLDLIPSINYAVIQKQKIKNLLAIGINYKPIYYILKHNFKSKDGFGISPFGIFYPILSLNLSNNFFVLIGKKTLGIQLSVTFCSRQNKLIIFEPDYTIKDYISEFDYEIDGNIQKVLYKTLGFNLYYQL